ncbi:MAG: CDP-alcohol phosphatidyltransferase family protein [Myxococcales bacterium]|nr:CDP-alcohol phosphatidyltransferase family protein [Myxococcales bacterium]
MAAEWRTIPNLITLGRLALVPVFLALQLTGRPRWALVCFAVAMASDFIDGLLARVLHQRSRIGGILDPAADKLLLLAGLVTLMAEGRVPLWLVALVAFRDATMTLGAIVVQRKNLEVPIAPTRIGKYATFALSCLIVLALVGLTAESPLLVAYTAVVGFIAGLCVAISTVQYSARFGYLFFAPPRSSPSVDDEKPRPR